MSGCSQMSSASATSAPFSPSETALFCRTKCRAQSLERGSFRMDFSTKFGKEIPSQICVKKGQFQHPRIPGRWEPGGGSFSSFVARTPFLRWDSLAPLQGSFGPFTPGVTEESGVSSRGLSALRALSALWAQKIQNGAENESKWTTFRIF